MGKEPNLVQGETMNTGSEAETTALRAAEEILRRLYGDDLKGCPVRLQTIADILLQAYPAAVVRDELVDLYDKVIEAVAVLSTPPEPDKVADPQQLQSLLSKRLDAIRTVAERTAQTVKLLKRRPPDSA